MPGVVLVGVDTPLGGEQVERGELQVGVRVHRPKLMIDIIARRILAEMPGTFVGKIHDSIMTTPDKAEAVRAIMVEEFGRFGLKPTIRLESYQSI